LLPLLLLPSQHSLLQKSRPYSTKHVKHRANDLFEIRFAMLAAGPDFQIKEIAQMKLVLATALALFISGSAYAQAQAPAQPTAQTPKACEELKTEIAQKLDAKGVKSYTLEIVAKDKDAEGKVVGTCEGGTKKIVYRKSAAPAEAPAAAPSKP
jgi:hypothetical protein